MQKKLTSFVDDNEIPLLLDFLFNGLKPSADLPLSLHNDIQLAFRHFTEAHGEAAGGPRLSSARRYLAKIQEILHFGDSLVLLRRHRRANHRAYRLQRTASDVEEITIRDFLTLKEQLFASEENGREPIEINLAPFYDYGPSLRDPDTIGNGIRHLNRYMSANLSQSPEKWNLRLYEFLKLHHLHGTQLLLDGATVGSVEELENSLEDCVDFLERCEDPENLAAIGRKLEHLGFLRGWGDSRDRMLETFLLLQDLLEQPNEVTLEEFLSRIPMVSKVALISPHGWFGQHNVLGRPDTGGQVVYILDQAKALEDFLREDLRRAGLDITPKILILTRLIPEHEGTTSNLRLEPVEQTENCFILRVPFREKEGRVVEHWISRFRIWPYLDRYAREAEQELLAEFGGRPDLIVGNYSDGNLVGTLLSKSLGVIQCNIAHALEKSKYLFSDLYWHRFEEEYNFSIQFTADLIAMNHANFIISSTRQEITGTETSIGQYESYQFFTMPGLMRVTSGINLFHPRFNVIPPGVNEEIFFPYTEKSRRDPARGAELARSIFEDEDENSIGRLARPELPPIFSIARLDRIKNLTGLAEAYGRNEELRSRANLVVVASVLNPEHSKDAEEQAEIARMYEIIERHGLRPHMRWLGRRLAKEETGEIYRVIADRGGVFVQPALFEAFGLTILEAMHSGLPVFATAFGGPSEIIVDRQSGFLINPTVYEEMSGTVADFFAACEADPDHWLGFSERGLRRARENFTWGLYCRRLTRLTKVYGFWKYATSNLAKARMSQYTHLLHQLFYGERANRLPGGR